MAYFYCDVDFVNSYAEDIQDMVWLNLQEPERLYILDIATSDIESVHGQPRKSDVPAFYGNYDISIACRYQALLVARTLGERLAADKAKVLTRDGFSFSDSIVSFAPRSTALIDYRAKVIIGDVMRQNGVYNSYGQRFKRG